MIAQAMGDQQGFERLRKPRHVLGDIDQRHGEVARRVQSKRLCSRPMPQNDQTSGILPITSTISPSTAAARSADSWWSGRPAAARRIIVSTTTTATKSSTADIGKLTVTTNMIAAKVATHGGSTFHTNMFSSV